MRFIETSGDVPPEPKEEATKEAEPVNKPDQPGPMAEKREPMATKTKPKPQKTQRKPTQETVVARARRMVRKEMREVAKALGMEDYDEEAFKEKLEEMNRAREENQSALERTEGRAKSLEEQNAELRAKNHRLQDELNKAQKAVQEAEQAREAVEAEYEIRDALRSVGFRDEAVDFGIQLFKKHLANLDDDVQVDEEYMRKFFEEKKKDPKSRYLFREEEVTAGPKSVAEETPNQDGHQGATQGQEQLPDQGAPKPAAQGGDQGDQVDALSMDRQDFNRHTMDKYGFRPGA